MSRLDDHPLFEGVSRSARDRLAARVQIRRYAAGDVILRAGEVSTELHGLVTGAARVELGGSGRRVVMAPPQSFGEMSALSGNAVSATIVAQRDTETWVLTGADLFEMLAEEPAFFRNVATLLGERLRHRTRDVGEVLRAAVAVLVADLSVGEPTLVLQGLYQGVRHYEPASLVLDAQTFDCAALATRMQQWRTEGAGAHIMMLLIRPDQMDAIRAHLESVDIVLWVVSGHNGQCPLETADAGAADVATLRLAARTAVARSERWSHALDASIFSAAANNAGSWQREQWPDLDRLVRQICGREIGVALGAGGAAGLAHLGFLEVLEDAGVPLDFLCGSSIGAIVSMGYAHFGTARAAADVARAFSAEFKRNVSLSWVPRAALVSPARIDAMFHEMFGHAEFAKLGMPVAAVTADLVAARRVILDSGLLSVAARATSAIPGLFPPVRIGDAMLVDGALVTRVPADLLATRRSGLRLASLIEPEKSADAAPGRAAADAFEARLDRLFGLRTVLAASWNMLGWWDSAAQAQQADLVIRIPTRLMHGLQFTQVEALIDCGRRATLSYLPAIQAAAQRVLAPGVP